MPRTFIEELEHRDALCSDIVAAIRHLPHETQLAIVLGWMSTERLTEAAATICERSHGRPRARSTMPKPST